MSFYYGQRILFIYVTLHTHIVIGRKIYPLLRRFFKIKYPLKFSKSISKLFKNCISLFSFIFRQVHHW